MRKDGDDLMQPPTTFTKRDELLADVAEMYYVKEMNQSEIAKKIGMTRSMVSKYLSAAKVKGIVQIQIQRPVVFNLELRKYLKEKYKIRDAFVIEKELIPDEVTSLVKLGLGASMVLKKYICPNCIVGTAWGSAVNATIDALEMEEFYPVKVIQLLGEAETQDKEYYDHALIQRFAKKIMGEAYYLTAPLVVDNPSTAEALVQNQNIREVLQLGKKCDLAVIGIGTLQKSDGSFQTQSYIPKDNLKSLLNLGAVGNVCARFYNVKGDYLKTELDDRIIGITVEDLIKIPIRLGIAAGQQKIEALKGALLGGFVNVLVTDYWTAKSL
jgi:DNA-binding transcriptional regulator LsrR (DeoR family)